jgi:hypothetical protein
MGTLGNANDITLTDQQKARIDNRIAELKSLLESQHYGPGFDESNPDHRLFFQTFYGMGNDRDNVSNGGRYINPELFGSFRTVIALVPTRLGTSNRANALQKAGAYTCWFDSSGELNRCLAGTTHQSISSFRNDWHIVSPVTNSQQSLAGQAACPP